MGESLDLHAEAGKEKEQTLANLRLAEEATSKDEVEIEKILQEQKSENTQYFIYLFIYFILLFCHTQ